MPAIVSGLFGSQIGTALGSPTGQAALQAVNGIADTTENAIATAIGLYVNPNDGPINGYGFLDYGGPGS